MIKKISTNLNSNMNYLFCFLVVTSTSTFYLAMLCCIGHLYAPLAHKNSVIYPLQPLDANFWWKELPDTAMETRPMFGCLSAQFWFWNIFNRALPLRWRLNACIDKNKSVSECVALCWDWPENRSHWEQWKRVWILGGREKGVSLTGWLSPLQSLNIYMTCWQWVQRASLCVGVFVSIGRGLI